MLEKIKNNLIDFGIEILFYISGVVLFIIDLFETNLGLLLTLIAAIIFLFIINM